MRKTWTSLKQRKNTIVFLLIIALIAIFCGVLYFYKVNNTIIANLKLDFTNINFSSNIIYHVIFLSVILFFSFCIIGAILGLFLFFYEFLSIGFLASLFFSSFGVSGIIYCVIFIILYKMLYIICLSQIFINSLYLSKNILGFFLLKKDNDLKKSAIVSFSTIIKYSVFLLLYDFFLSLCGNVLLGIFDFLI